MPENPDGDKFLCWYLEVYSGYYRRIKVTYENNLHEDVLNAVYAIVLLYTSPNTEIYIRNNFYSNVATIQGGFYLTVSDTVVLENEVYENTNHYGFDIYAITNTNTLTMRNITVRNVHGVGSSSDYYFYFLVNTGGNVTLDGLSFEDSNIGLQTGFFVEGSSHTLSLKNLHYKNVSVGTSNSLITSGVFRKFELSNISFTNIFGATEDDDNNFMLTISSLNLNNALGSVIKNVTVSNSTIGLLNFNSITGTTSQRVNFDINQVTYSN